MTESSSRRRRVVIVNTQTTPLRHAQADGRQQKPNNPPVLSTAFSSFNPDAQSSFLSWLSVPGGNVVWRINFCL
ncbi:uncharacterized protein YALI1_D10674g [Yarrowia lipolytica]|uniref:Uncharacterized protein n=1 Tax=Yarrowia lipolytica TaxID=4952 RepID=A0A1D8NDS9_YARLL|nr:hypothetical protein YALI1_D10674g [Yarrowia lipolytica]